MEETDKEFIDEQITDIISEAVKQTFGFTPKNEASDEIVVYLNS